MAKATRYTPELIDRYMKEGFWDQTTLSDLWARNARLYPEAEAIIDARHRLTWSQANEWIDKLTVGRVNFSVKGEANSVGTWPIAIVIEASDKGGLAAVSKVTVNRDGEVKAISDKIDEAK